MSFIATWCGVEGVGVPLHIVPRRGAPPVATHNMWAGEGAESRPPDRVAGGCSRLPGRPGGPGRKVASKRGFGDGEGIPVTCTEVPRLHGGSLNFLPVGQRERLTGLRTFKSETGETRPRTRCAGVRRNQLPKSLGRLIRPDKPINTERRLCPLFSS